MNAQRPISAAAEQLEELAQVIGQVNLSTLCKVFGGTKIYIPAKMSHNHPIAEAIGLKAAGLMADHYFGTSIDFPKAHLRRQRVIELAKSGKMTVADAARACDYTERRVYQLLAAEKDDDNQLDLFR